MAKHSISEAARMTGVARATLHRHIKDGKLSKEIGADGKPCIDTSELSRVYGDLSHGDSNTRRSISQLATPSNDSLDRPLQAELEILRREKVERLEASLAELREDRDSWKAQAERLALMLTDQRKEEPAPGPETGQVAPEPPQKAAGGFFASMGRWMAGKGGTP